MVRYTIWGHFEVALMLVLLTVDFDPEDVQSHGVEREDQMDVDLSAAREHYVEVG